VLLADTAVSQDLRGCRVQLVGVDPVSYHRRAAQPAKLADDRAELRILLCHFPGIARRLPPAVFDVILSGHLHAGQITLPYPGGRVMLAHPRGRYCAGLYEGPTGVMHVSPGTGTTFVPFRFFARPEATELVLRAASPGAGVDSPA
jgi:predicted MPP superfamily phosphohydrolase